MKKQSLLLASVLLLSTSAVSAVEVAGVDVADTMTSQEQVLQLNGAGVRSKFFMDLYVGSLYTVGPTDQAANVVDGEQISAIRLNITSGMITSEKMTEAMHDGFDRATDGDTSAIADSINSFIATFAEPIKEGDQFTLVSVPGTGIVSYKNGQQLSVTSGEDFRKAVLAIWLGDNPTDKGLKKEMLKG
ncbi:MULTISPECIES: chalcone isomerase family protein [Shewanella]|uniref:chalcone isomerase family protein n=1 Tax=Shewanella TaxID=22 RepID=UPI001EFEA3C0|nr:MULTISPECIES: chalcone isomerase family protein [Shewanella]MCG9747954.1 chalcone isomerase family protein [Shewanella sp. Isolate8]MCL2910647.1 chalcone isomerase family protein [Shewanella aquimarina]